MKFMETAWRRDAENKREREEVSVVSGNRRSGIIGDENVEDRLHQDTRSYYEYPMRKMSAYDESMPDIFDLGRHPLGTRKNMQ